MIAVKARGREPRENLGKTLFRFLATEQIARKVGYAQAI